MPLLPGAVPGSGVVIVDNTGVAATNSTAAAETAAHNGVEVSFSPVLRSATGLDRQPPYFMLMFCTAVSAVIQVLIFGPQLPEHGEEDGPVTVALQYWSLLAFLKTMLTDLAAVIVVLFSGLSFSETLGGIAIVAASSPNVAVGITMSALSSLYDNVGLWRKAHRNEDMPSLDEAMLSKGPVFRVYHLLTKFFGAVPGALVTMYCIPAFIAYFWLLIPAGFLLSILSCCILPCCTAFCNGHAICNDPALLAVVAGQSQYDGFSDLLNAADVPYNPYEAVHRENSTAGATPAPASSTTSNSTTRRDISPEVPPQDAAPSSYSEMSSVGMEEERCTQTGSNAAAPTDTSAPTPASRTRPQQANTSEESTARASAARDAESTEQVAAEPSNAAGENAASAQEPTPSGGRGSGPASRADRAASHSTDDDEELHSDCVYSCECLFLRWTGAPFSQLFMYYFSCMQMFLLALFAPTAARLYAGRGYLPALFHTIFDRSMSGWLGALHGDRNTSVLTCVSRWLDVVNWFI